jgi:hypothetical protein
MLFGTVHREFGIHEQRLGTVQSALATSSRARATVVRASKTSCSSWLPKYAVPVFDRSGTGGSAAGLRLIRAMHARQVRDNLSAWQRGYGHV